MRKLSETQIKNEISKLEDQINELEAKKYYLQTAIDYKEDVYDKADFVEDCNNKIKDRMLELGLAGMHDVRVDLDLPEGLHKPEDYTHLNFYIDENLAFYIFGKIDKLYEPLNNVVLHNLKLILTMHDNDLSVSTLYASSDSITVRKDGLSIDIRLNNFNLKPQIVAYDLKASTKIANINEDNEVEKESYEYLAGETRQIDFNMTKSCVGIEDVPHVAKQFIAAYKDALDCVDLKVKKRQELDEEDTRSEDVNTTIGLPNSSDLLEVKPAATITSRF